MWRASVQDIPVVVCGFYSFAIHFVTCFGGCGLMPHDIPFTRLNLERFEFAVLSSNDETH